MLTLYNPPTSYYSNTPAALPSLSLAYLSAVLNRAGIPTRCIDLEALKIRPDRVQPTTEIVGFTCLSAGEKGVRDCIASLRERGYRGKIVVGGAHVTVNPKSIPADLIVTGECEGNIAQLILNATGIREGERAEIDDLPLPDWDHYSPDITTYKGQYKVLSPRTAVSLWTRGCPYSCIYCSDVIFNHQPKRYRKPESIEAEMRYLKSKGLTTVYVYDDEIIGSKAPEGWMKEVADRLEPLGMRWMAQARCSKKYVTREVLEDAKRAGCFLILWGVESFSQNVLNAVRKHTTPEDIWHSLRLSHEVGIKNSVFTMIGNYKETEADLRITALALAQGYKEGVIDYRQTFITQTMEGTELERIAREEGWYQKPQVNGAYMKTAEYDTPWLTVKTMQQYRGVYNDACPVPQP